MVVRARDLTCVAERVLLCLAEDSTLMLLEVHVGIGLDRVALEAERLCLGKVVLAVSSHHV